MSLLRIKQELKKFDKDKLIELISDLYKSNNSVKEYLDFFINPNEAELFKKYKAKIDEAFFPKRGHNLKLKDGKQAIADFKKLGPAAELLADLMLFYVECGVKYTNDFGDINEAFYSSLEKTYSQALKFMQKEGILSQFKNRALKIVDSTKDIGWGFHYYLIEAYCDHYTDETGEE